MYFKSQKYSQLKKRCIKEDKLFFDAEFPAINKSLYFSKIEKDIEWKRPMELCANPKLLASGINIEEYKNELPALENQLWFLTACTALAQNQTLWNKIVINYREQEWSEKNIYAGIYRFQFWQFGKWVEVVIDDLLPTRQGKLIFSRSPCPFEFWNILLEKAYSKLYGDYETLAYNSLENILSDFTGGISERFNISKLASEKENSLIQMLTWQCENKSLMVCLIENFDESVQYFGLKKDQGYIINSIRTFQKGGNTTTLVRLKNPCGVQQWSGPWSISSLEWTSLSQKEKQKYGIKTVDESSFWMSIEDMMRIFTDLVSCQILNTSVFSMKKTWHEKEHLGQWKPGKGHSDRSGGNLNNVLANPQYIFNVDSPTEDLVIVLAQDNAHVFQKISDEELNYKIGVVIIRVEENRKYRLNQLLFDKHNSDCEKKREIVYRTTLKLGNYILIPCSEKVGLDRNFLLRIFSTSNLNSKELTKSIPKVKQLCNKPLCMVTKIIINEVNGLDSSVTRDGVDLFLSIKCEGKTVKTPSVKYNQTTTLNFSYIFYRKNPKEPIELKVYTSKNLHKTFVGQTNTKLCDSENFDKQTLNLFGKGKQIDIEIPGNIIVDMCTTTDLYQF